MDKTYEEILKKLVSYSEDNSPILSRIREEIKKATETVETSENQLTNIEAIIEEAENKLGPLKEGVAIATDYFKSGSEKLSEEVLEEIGYGYSPKKIEQEFTEKADKKINEYTSLIMDKKDEIKDLEQKKDKAETEITELTEILEDKLKEQQALSDLFAKVGNLDTVSDTKSIISMFIKDKDSKEGLTELEVNLATELFVFPNNHDKIWEKLKSMTKDEANEQAKTDNEEKDEIKIEDKEKTKEEVGVSEDTDLYDLSALFSGKITEQPVVEENQEEDSLASKKAKLIKHLEDKGIIFNNFNKTELIENTDEVNLDLVDKIIDLLQTKGNKNIEDISLVIGAILKINKLNEQDLIHNITPNASISDIILALIDTQKKIFDVKDNDFIPFEYNDTPQDFDAYFSQYNFYTDEDNERKKIA